MAISSNIPNEIYLFYNKIQKFLSESYNHVPGEYSIYSTNEMNRATFYDILFKSQQKLNGE